MIKALKEELRGSGHGSHKGTETRVLGKEMSSLDLEGFEEINFMKPKKESRSRI